MLHNVLMTAWPVALWMLLGRTAKMDMYLSCFTAPFPAIVLYFYYITLSLSYGGEIAADASGGVAIGSLLVGFFSPEINSRFFKAKHSRGPWDR